jgi:hypothetical protein
VAKDAAPHSAASYCKQVRTLTRFCVSAFTS